MSLRIRQVKKWPSPITKFHSNLESLSQTEYTGKFSGQSGVLHFSSDSKGRWCIFLEKIIIIKKCFELCQIIIVLPQSWTGSTKMNSLQDFEWFSGSCGGLLWFNSQKSIFGPKLWVFFPAIPYVPYSEVTWKVNYNTPFNIIRNKNFAFLSFSLKFFFSFRFLRKLTIFNIDSLDKKMSKN